MESIPLAAYIAAGSFAVDLVGVDIAPDKWQLSLPVGQPVADGEYVLSAETQAALLQLPEFSAVVRPLQRRWLRFSFKAFTPTIGICRVYVLPDDEYRRLVLRSDPKVRRDLQRLLNGLDYAQKQWDGTPNEIPTTVHDARVRVGGDDNDENRTLLQMFNTIPSPQPQDDILGDESYRRVMDALATSSVPGLKTVLYGHQTRSASVMLQRELQPGRVVDPRLLQLRELTSSDGVTERSEGVSEERVNHGNSERSEERRWYYDDVTGEVLRTARFYDGVSGGILAEEMGTGKTLICLALVLATRAFPAEMPGLARQTPRRRDSPRGAASLVDMAARVISFESVPWKLYLADTTANASEFRHCIAAIQRNPAQYTLPKRVTGGAREVREREARDPRNVPDEVVTLSSCSLVLVPANLVRQWEEEITKHTEGLRVLVVTGNKSEVPSTEAILESDILLMSIPRFEKLAQDREVTRVGYSLRSPLAAVHFKRVIVDEGHRLGNSKMGRKSNLLLVLDCLQVSTRWIVTGTPSTGLFGVEGEAVSEGAAVEGDDFHMSGTSTPGTPGTPGSHTLTGTAALQERKDLERIGAMAALYLRVRPWANTAREAGGLSAGINTSNTGDTPADWAVYVMQPHHSNRSRGGRRDGLRATLDSLIVRHRTADIGDLLPAVDERVVVLDGSVQDRLCLNLFAMMIVFNAVQSQRTDQDYFFHPKQRPALLRLLSNIRQATFFGANFYSVEDIQKALETAETFLRERKVPISIADEALLKEAIAFGHMAVRNRFKRLADACHEVPIYVADMPGGGAYAAAWSIDGEPSQEHEYTCTTAPLVHALQQYLRPCIDAPTSLRAMFDDGRFVQKGWETRTKQQEQVQAQNPRKGGNTAAASNNGTTATASSSKGDPTLAGNTKLGEDNHASGLKKRTSAALSADKDKDGLALTAGVAASSADVFLAAPLANTRLISTASAKLSYLLDAIVKYQADEQIIVFYDNENVAFYLAEHLEILQIQHLIYARGITAERRAQYVATFNGTSADSTSPFRVLLMDLSQAAFGLDMRSASRVYFTSPVLNPQVEAQAVGRVRRISQRHQKERMLTVETLVLRDSLEEVIVDRRSALTPAEHRRIKTLLDDGPIYEWVRNARIQGQYDDDVDDDRAQMAPLKWPQFLFGRGFGRVVHPDEGLVVVERRQPSTPGDGRSNGQASTNGHEQNNGEKNSEQTPTLKEGESDGDPSRPIKKRKMLPKAPVRFA
ncbi:hypothetical protein SEUCBS139899_003268 [Sporothrix eucalyptigena]